ncbi:MAG: site-specific DNA-methyltransferase [Chitinophagaceae bacterium]|nr:MAG: DNA methylase N-4/N-6 domain-containing protein [Bacteroidetes bacterium OLB11]MCC6447718.1 site-specific DNA-methyltransferase [Chitinophagaceae bacterium]HMN32929.1 site-specific DNA-methyltransferase [Chitinophagaceae bacterium]
MKSSNSFPKYGLQWERDEIKFKKFKVEEIKEKNIILHKDKPTHQLIEGDNIYSLKFLQKNYQSKIDFIYIDPPYNTGYKQGQEGFVYDDFLQKNEFQYNHSAWLNFLFPRLEIAKSLLSQTGLIFISIDEGELAHLKLLCDELFGEENFIQYFIWKKRTSGGQYKKGSVVAQTEFILAYAKEKAHLKFHKIQTANQPTTIWRDYRKSGGQWQKKYRPKQHFPFFYDPVANTLSLQKEQNHHIEIRPQNAKNELGFWENGIETATKRLKNNELKVVYIRHSKKYKILQLKKSNSLQNAGNFIDVPSIKGTNEIKFFDLNFNNAKPISLIQYLLSISTNRHSIVLDFFAGSGSTAQAVMEWNELNQTQLTCILCTSNEYNICENITYTRLQRIINGYENKSQKKYKALKQNLQYFKIITLK